MLGSCKYSLISGNSKKWRLHTLHGPPRACVSPPCFLPQHPDPIDYIPLAPCCHRFLLPRRYGGFEALGLGSRQQVQSITQKILAHIPWRGEGLVWAH